MKKSIRVWWTTDLFWDVYEATKKRIAEEQAKKSSAIGEVGEDSTSQITGSDDLPRDSLSENQFECRSTSKQIFLYTKKGKFASRYFANQRTIVDGSINFYNELF